jgi:hypothetical protein
VPASGVPGLVLVGFATAMTRIALGITVLLVLAWILVMPALLPGWTVSSLLRTMAVVVDIPVAVWLAGVGWTAFRRSHARGSGSAPEVDLLGLDRPG